MAFTGTYSFVGGGRERRGTAINYGFYLDLCGSRGLINITMYNEPISEGLSGKVAYRVGELYASKACGTYSVLCKTYYEITGRVKCGGVVACVLRSRGNTDLGTDGFQYSKITNNAR